MYSEDLYKEKFPLPRYKQFALENQMLVYCAGRHETKREKDIVLILLVGPLVSFTKDNVRFWVRN